MKESIKKADILVEAIPYIQAFRGKVIVAKYGGSAIDNPEAMRSILQDLIFLSTVGIRAVLVHGGGPAITRELEKAGGSTKFINGRRVTDAKTIRVVNRALTEVNRRLVAQIHALGGHAESVLPKDQVIIAEPHKDSDQLGFVGEVGLVHTGPIRMVLTHHAIPVISPVGVNDRQLYNINADDAACSIAGHLDAAKLVLLTNVRGVMRRAGDVASLIPTITKQQARKLIDRGIIHGGMMPKVHACMNALSRGVRKTHIIDASIPHALLLEIFTKRGIGTEIVK